MPSEKRQRQKEREQAAREARLAEERRRQQRRTWMGIGGLVVLVIALAALYSFLGGDDDDGQDVATETGSAEQSETFEPGAEGGMETEEPEAGTDTEEEGEDVDEALGSDEPLPCPPADGTAEQTLEFPAPPPDCLEEGVDYQAVFDTTAGEIRVDLNEGEVPQTVNNFVYLARYGYYEGVEMFRSNTGIDILQSGAPHTNSPSDPGPGYTIEDEGDFSDEGGALTGPYTYEPGQLVMARAQGPDAAGAQFFFTTGPDAALLNDPGTYVVFGEVTEGMDVLESIMETHVDSGTGPGEGAPDPVPVIDSVEIVES